MDINDFAEMTQEVIASDGFEGYLPTLILPQRMVISALEGIPDGVDVEQAALEWAAKIAKAGEEYLLAYKINDHQFRVVRSDGSALTQADFDVPMA